MQCIAQQVSDFLLLSEPSAQGAEKDMVHEHISRHMLHPRVRVAVMLRQLLDFSVLLQSSLVVNDSGVCTVDKSNVELYLKVIGQIMTLYKADTTGMLFADDDKSAVSATTSTVPATGTPVATASGGGGNGYSPQIPS